MAFDPDFPVPTFPDTDLDARVEIKRQDGTWLDLSGKVFTDGSGETISITRGIPDESTTASPSTFSATLDNSDGSLSNLNPLSPNYGQLPLGSELRASIPNGLNYLDCQADTASGVAGFEDFNEQSFEIWVDVDASNLWYGSVLASKWSSVGNERSWIFTTTYSGSLYFVISFDGSTDSQIQYESAVKLPKSHGRMSIRCAVQSVSGNIYVTFYVGQNMSNWRQLGTSYVFTTPNTIYNSTAPVCFFADPAQQDAYFTGCAGRGYAAALVPLGATDTSSAYSAIDFTAQSVGATQFTDNAGNEYLAFGSAAVNDRNYRFWGSVGAWPQSWTPGDPNARVAISAGGLLRRMGQAQNVANSAFYRAFTLEGAYGSGVISYYPMETHQGATGATRYTDVVGKGSPMLWNLGTVNPGQNSNFACSDALPVLNGNMLTATIPAYTIPSGGSSIVRWLMSLDSSGTTENTILCQVWYAGNGSNFSSIVVRYVSGTSLELTVTDPSGVGIYSETFTTTGSSVPTLDGTNMYWSIELQPVSGGGFTCNVGYLPIGEGVAYAQTASPNLGATIPGNVPRIERVSFNTGAISGAVDSNMSVGHMSIQTVWTSLFNMQPPLNAYAGELAGTRFIRLCKEESIQCRLIGDPTDTPAMGPQTEETIATLLQECADLDHGVWFETRDVLGFGYRTRASMLNQRSGIPLNYNQDHISLGLSPTVDDQIAKNDVTVESQSSSSTARAVLSDGSPTSIQVMGDYDTEIELNADNDAQLTDLAYWNLHSLAVNEPRYTSIPVDLANKNIWPVWQDIVSAEIGDLITVANPPEWLPPGQIAQVMQGVNETFGLKSFTEAWNGVPASPWNVAFSDDFVYGRVDTSDSVLADAVTAGSVAEFHFGPSFTPLSEFPPYYTNATLSVTPDGFLAIVADSDAASAGLWQLQGDSYSATPGSTYGTVIKLYAGNNTLNAVEAGIAFVDSSGDTTYESSASVTVTNGAYVWVCVSAVAPAGTATWWPYIVDREGSPAGTSMVVEEWYGGACGTLTVNAVDGFAWTTAAADLPFDVNVGGERVTVLSVGASSSVTYNGATVPQQVFTVLRSIDGVVKAQAAGTGLQLWESPVLSL